MRFACRADSIGRTYQDDSERSSRRKANEAETGGANRLINCRRDPPAKVLAARISMSHLVPLLEFNHNQQFGRFPVHLQMSLDVEGIPAIKHFEQDFVDPLRIGFG